MRVFDNGKAVLCRTMYFCVEPGILVSNKCYNDVSYLLRFLAEITSIVNGSGMTLTHPPGQNRRRFADDILKCIFLNEHVCVLIRISLKFVPRVRIDNKKALVEVMAWHRTGDKPLSEPKLTQFTDAYKRH